MACEPARKTKPSLRLILGLAALRMFCAVFIFGFSNSSSFKVIPLKAVVLLLPSGLFPSLHQPSQKVQRQESPDLLKIFLSASCQDSHHGKTFQPPGSAGIEKGRSLMLYFITSWLQGFLNCPSPQVGPEFLYLFSHEPRSVLFLFFNYVH